MISGDRDRGSHPDFLPWEEYGPIFGWPAYPPKEISNTSEWWKEERRILPTGYPKLPNTSFVSINGTPKAGKSTLADLIVDNYQYPTRNDLEIINPDGLFVQGARGIKHVALEVLYPNSFNEDDDPIAYPMEEENPLDTLFFENWRTQFWVNKVTELAYDIPDNYTRTIIAQRDANDITVFIHAYLTHKRDPQFAIPCEWRQFVEENIDPILTNAQLAAKFTDAVILVGASQETAQKRRQEKGSRGKGIVDSPFYNDLYSWYGYWIDHVWPTMHELHGTGLLVLNGENNLHENVEIALEFISEINNRRLPNLK